MESYISKMGTRKVEQGEVGHVVAAQVRLLREEKRLSLQALSRRLKALGRPILPSGLSKIEQGDRRVDVDDLVALAAALETVPSMLLMNHKRGNGRSGREHEESIDAGVAALRRAEAAGASRYEVLEWMNQMDRFKPMLERWERSIKRVTDTHAKYMESSALGRYAEHIKRVSDEANESVERTKRAVEQFAEVDAEQDTDE
jgi:transcriptional regulator with XRE-family HTH domain